MPEVEQIHNKEQFHEVTNETAEKYSVKLENHNSIVENPSQLSQEEFKTTKFQPLSTKSELSNKQVKILEDALTVYKSIPNESRIEWLSRLIREDTRTVIDWFETQINPNGKSISPIPKPIIEAKKPSRKVSVQPEGDKGSSPKKPNRTSLQKVVSNSDIIIPKTFRQGKTHVQRSQCQNHAYSEFERCRSCIRKNGDVCRFRDFRVFQEKSDGQLIYGPAFQSSTVMMQLPAQNGRNKGTSKSTHKPSSIPKELFLLGSRLSLPTEVWMEHENYLRKIIAPSLLEIVNREINFMCNVTYYQRATPMGVRQMCDVCLTSIFNGFWLCCVCGVEICLYCYDEWTTRNPKVNMCSYKRTHEKPQMIRVSRISLKELENLRNVLQSVITSSDNASTLERPPDLATNHLSREAEYLYDDYNNVTLETFQEKWRRGETIVIRNLLSKINLDWSPSYFIEHYGEEIADMVDCTTGCTVASMTVGDFFRGFSDMSLRPKNHKEKHLVLRIKDWPSDMDFKDKFPSHFADFMKTLPFQEYTQRKGILNLASRLPAMVVPPDLGPKMYNAYGSDDGENGVGTTPLHLDMADAVNLMIYSIDAVNPEESRPIKGEGSLAEDHRDAGAVWDIYHFQDLPKIRVFLREYADEIGHSVDDPIHDQVFYLNETLRQRLFAKYGVRGWRVYQNPGDAVFVPAGCAHQVCNYKSCIKVAMDFVSPENVSRCAELTKEFRLLSQGHRRRQDLLQLESILYHSWLNSESAINGEKVDELLPEENEDLVDLKTPPRKIKTKVTSKVSSKMEDSPRSSRSSRRKLPENTKKPVEEIPNDFRDEEATLDDEIVDLLSSPQSKTRKRPSNSARPRGSVTIPNSRNSKLIRKKIYRDDSSSDSSLTDLSDLIESSDDSSASQNKKPISSIKATKSSKSHKRFADNSDLDFSSDEEDVKPKKSRKSIKHSPSSKLSSNHRRTENANKYSAGVEKPPVITRLKSDIGIALNATSKKLKKQTKSSPLKPAPKIKLILNTRDQESEDLPASNALSSTEALGTSKENPPDIMYNQSTTDPAKDSDSEFAIALLGLSGSKNSHIFSPPSAESKRD